jgi:hypothetical protein
MLANTNTGDDMNAIVTASNARATETSVVDGIDVDVIYSLDGGEHHAGTVTLAPKNDGRLGSTWAQSPEEWVSRALLRGISGLGDGEYRTALSEIEAEATAAASAYHRA